MSLAVIGVPAGWVEFLASEPVLIELPLLGIVALGLWWWARRTALRTRALSEHPALGDLFLGYEAALAGDLTTASHRLGRACGADPRDDSAAQTLSKVRRGLDASGDVPPETACDEPLRGNELESGIDDVARFAAFLAAAPELARPLDTPRRVVDALEVNRQHLARLVESALLGDPQARTELREVGGMAAGELLRAVAPTDDDPAPHDLDQVARLATGLGPELLPALFAALREPALVAGRAREAAVELVVAVATSLGAAGQSALVAVAASREPLLRDVVLDVALALGDTEPFDALARTASRAELRRAYERADRSVLARALAGFPAGHFALREALVGPSPHVLEALVEALGHARAPAAIRDRLLEDDAIRQVGPLIVARAASGDVAASSLLDAAGPKACDALALRATDLVLDETLRTYAMEALVRLGGAAVPPLMRTLGRGPAPADAQVIAIVTEIGGAAVLPLRTVLQELLASKDPVLDDHTGRVAVDILASIRTTGARRVLEALARQTRSTTLATRARQRLGARKRDG